MRAVFHFMMNLGASDSEIYVLWGLELEASLPTHGTAERWPQGWAESSGIFMEVLALHGPPPVFCGG